MELSGNLVKMYTTLEDQVKYSLKLNNNLIDINKLIDKKIRLDFNGQINCIECGKKTKKSFNQGFCYQCFKTSPKADESVIRPELSKAHLGISRDIEWAKEHDLIPHYVYLSISSHLKIGVTRHHQIPTRWIDQGASSAIIVAETPNRHIAGVIEVWLKKFYSDKTSWQAMLKNKLPIDIDLVKEKEKAIKLLPIELQRYAKADCQTEQINYPVEEYPTKVSPLSFDKTPIIEGVLKGIKGQYLIFEEGKVLNIRKHNGYYINLSVES
ncbi:DUF2797 domain-containing protein [Prolixibacteraceae bacterium JC049]|nr:DUF2797 domain-containing protein [Prolixibacteraceae bacterium JC049]